MKKLCCGMIDEGASGARQQECLEKRREGFALAMSIAMVVVFRPLCVPNPDHGDHRGADVEYAINGRGEQRH